MSVVTKQMLDAAVILGRNQERERIIKLLEFELWEKFEISHEFKPPWATMEMLITAIKGENK
jgi:hypothetical protein